MPWGISIILIILWSIGLITFLYSRRFHSCPAHNRYFNYESEKEKIKNIN